MYAPVCLCFLPFLLLLLAIWLFLPQIIKKTRLKHIVIVIVKSGALTTNSNRIDNAFNNLYH